MRKSLVYLHNDSGVALVAGLVILVLLTSIGTYAINMAQTETTLSANLKASKQAFYLADAGLQWATAQIDASAALPPVPIPATQSLGSGSYAVTFPNHFPIGVDFEYTLTVRSVGSFGNASKILQAVITKTFDLSDSAVAIRGLEADSSFSGDNFSIDGRDYDHVTEALTAEDQRFGITVQSQTMKTTVNNALSAQQKNNVIGEQGTGTTASIGVSQEPSSATVTSLANALCTAAPAANKFNTPINGTYSPPANAIWGTRASPQTYCVTGVGTPGNMSTDINGTFNGVGVLVVRDSDLVVNANFRFEGLIIVTGAKVGFGLMGGWNQKVYGSVMINDTMGDGPSYREEVLSGTATIRLSRSALKLARQLVPAASLSSIIMALPATARQRSWTEVNQ